MNARRIPVVHDFYTKCPNRAPGKQGPSRRLLVRHAVQASLANPPNPPSEALSAAGDSPASAGARAAGRRPATQLSRRQQISELLWGPPPPPDPSQSGLPPQLSPPSGQHPAASNGNGAPPSAPPLMLHPSPQRPTQPHGQTGRPHNASGAGHGGNGTAAIASDISADTQTGSAPAALGAAELEAQHDAALLLRGGRHRTRQPVAAGSSTTAELTDGTGDDASSSTGRRAGSGKSSVKPAATATPRRDGVRAGKGASPTAGGTDAAAGTGNGGKEQRRSSSSAGGGESGDGGSNGGGKEQVRLRLRGQREPAASAGTSIRLRLPQRPPPLIVKELLAAQEEEGKQQQQRQQKQRGRGSAKDQGGGAGGDSVQQLHRGLGVAAPQLPPSPPDWQPGLLAPPPQQPRQAPRPPAAATAADARPPQQQARQQSSQASQQRPEQQQQRQQQRQRQQVPLDPLLGGPIPADQPAQTQLLPPPPRPQPPPPAPPGKATQGQAAAVMQFQHLLDPTAAAGVGNASASVLRVASSPPPPQAQHLQEQQQPQPQGAGQPDAATQPQPRPRPRRRAQVGLPGSGVPAHPDGTLWSGRGTKLEQLAGAVLQRLRPQAFAAQNEVHTDGQADGGAVAGGAGAGAGGVCHALVAGSLQGYNLLRALSYVQELLALASYNGMAATAAAPAAAPQGQRGGPGDGGGGGDDGGGSAAGLPPVLAFSTCGVPLAALRTYFEETVLYGTGPLPELGPATVPRTGPLQVTPAPPASAPPPTPQKQQDPAHVVGGGGGGGAAASAEPHTRLEAAIAKGAPRASVSGTSAPGTVRTGDPSPAALFPPMRGWPADTTTLEPHVLLTAFLLPPSALQPSGGGTDVATAGVGAADGGGDGGEPPALAVGAHADVHKLGRLAARQLRERGACRLAALGCDASASAIRVLVYTAMRASCQWGLGVLAAPRMTALGRQPRGELRTAEDAAAAAATVYGTGGGAGGGGGGGSGILPAVLLDKAPQLVLDLVACRWDEQGLPVAFGRAAVAAMATAAAAAATAAKAKAEAEAGNGRRSGEGRQRRSAPAPEARPAPEQPQSGQEAIGQQQAPELLPAAPQVALAPAAERPVGRPAPSPVALPLPRAAGPALSLDSREAGDRVAAAEAARGVAEAVAAGLAAGQRVRLAVAGPDALLRLPGVMHRAQGRVKGMEAAVRGAVVFAVSPRSAASNGSGTSTDVGSAADVEVFRLPFAALQRHIDSLPGPHPGAISWRRRDSGSEEGSDSAEGEFSAPHPPLPAGAPEGHTSGNGRRHSGKRDSTAGVAVQPSGRVGNGTTGGADTAAGADVVGGEDDGVDSSSAEQDRDGGSGAVDDDEVTAAAAALTEQLALYGAGSVLAWGRRRLAALLAVAAVSASLRDAAGLTVLVRVQQMPLREAQSTTQMRPWKHQQRRQAGASDSNKTDSSSDGDPWRGPLAARYTLLLARPRPGAHGGGGRGGREGGRGGGSLLLLHPRQLADGQPQRHEPGGPAGP